MYPICNTLGMPRVWHGYKSSYITGMAQVQEGYILGMVAGTSGHKCIYIFLNIRVLNNYIVPIFTNFKNMKYFAITKNNI